MTDSRSTALPPGRAGQRQPSTAAVDPAIPGLEEDAMDPQEVAESIASLSPGRLVHVTRYRGKDRDETGEVFEFFMGREGPCVGVRLFTQENESPQFKRYFVAEMEVSE